MPLPAGARLTGRSSPPTRPAWALTWTEEAPGGAARPSAPPAGTGKGGSGAAAAGGARLRQVAVGRGGAGGCRGGRGEGPRAARPRLRRPPPLLVPGGMQGQPIPGMVDIPILGNGARNIAYRRGEGAPVEVLHGKGPFVQSAVADDLSAFSGGRCESGRIWRSGSPMRSPSWWARLRGKGDVGTDLAAARRIDHEGKGFIPPRPLGKDRGPGPPPRRLVEPPRGPVRPRGRRSGPPPLGMDPEGTRDLVPLDDVGAITATAFPADGIAALPPRGSRAGVRRLGAPPRRPGRRGGRGRRRARRPVSAMGARAAVPHLPQHR